jgi:hypothetical protein
MKKKDYTITDRRGMSDGQEHPEEVCRVCGSKEVHSKNYGRPTMECVRYLQDQETLRLEKVKEAIKYLGGHQHSDTINKAIKLLKEVYTV